MEYIILWNNECEEYECDNMQEAEEYANSKVTEIKRLLSITIKENGQ